MTFNRVPAIFATFLLLFLLQESLLNKIDFFIGGFSLYLAFFMAWIMQDERNSAVATGFIAGFIADLSPTLEAPFGLWTFILTAMSYVLATNVRAALDAELSPVVMSAVTVIGSSIALFSFSSAEQSLVKKWVRRHMSSKKSLEMRCGRSCSHRCMCRLLSGFIEQL